MSDRRAPWAHSFFKLGAVALMAALAACTTPTSTSPAAPASSLPGAPAPTTPFYPAPSQPANAQHAPVLVPVPLPPPLHKRTQLALRLQPQQIWQLTYEGKPAFYLVEPCCDRMNTLHDAAGYARCAPPGGVSGKGDGRCPAPLPPSDQMRLVWERAR